MSKDGMNGKDLFIGAVIGGAIGATAALLLTPKTGRETRADLYKGLETAKEAVKEKSEQMAQRYGDVKGVTSHKWTDIRESAADTFKEAASTVEEGMGKAGKKVEEIGEKTANKLKS
ncbi:YtxH domain-containing protein [Paludifilum halophilum]|uniref:General stress protein n=1 Tax=Paludifilum halophilum TaxID=1642702 RepID=A0A235B9N1_9BACL|nr:YtxH domain-containing protein [Paludifilum halophilum]OYD09008.1 hypothetical protein CHM34_04330 [Paludifilum halophilum]